MKRPALLLLLLTACHAAVPTQTPGTLTVHLTSAGNADGAMVLVISGGTVGTVEAVNGYEVSSTTDGGGTHLLVLGNITTGALVRFQVPDIARAKEYVGLITQVADRSNFGLIDPAGYHVTIDEFP